MVNSRFHLNPRIDAFKATDKNGFILFVESDVKGSKKCDFKIFRVTRKSTVCLGDKWEPYSDLIGDITGWSDCPKYVQKFIEDKKAEVNME